MALASSRGLSNVPEEEGLSRKKEVTRVPSSPYLSPSSATTNFTISSTVGSANSVRSARKPASIRTLGRSSNDQLNTVAATAPSGSSSSSVKRTTSSSSTNTTNPTHQASNSTINGGGGSGHKPLKSSSSAVPVASNGIAPTQKYRVNPRLPHDKDAEPAASTVMYWSRAPVWGALPMRSMRGHTITLVDSTAWLIGGCDDKDSSKELYCFNTETMQWMLLDTVGDHPPPSRAHTATLIDRKIVVIGGGLGSLYYSSVYIFDTTTRRWYRPNIAQGPHPAPRRAHSAVYYKGRIWMFGGGNGLTALNDVWTLDITGGIGSSARPMRWEEMQTIGARPNSRGYHSANLIGNIMVVIGGSDSKECFTDVWCLNLDTLQWSSSLRQGQQTFKRLAHTSTQVGSYLFVIGGHTSTEYISEILLYDLVSLQYELRPRLFLGKLPSPRGYHEAILADSRLFVFGGFNGYTAFDDVHILDLAAGAYLPQVTSFTMGSGT